ncbi:phage integrase [Mycobacteroides abscessus subsp. bolletii]|nr:phage integrase [Mycobacteroides abscessus subsp. bolletii]SLD46259.1 phage integrase [Mycobacteroides abscessus subsp. bolletii]SLE35058.1 phage integrase [Mycobacteroides abscessus subsp. bolletii]
MSRGRPPRPIGVPGKVDLTELRPGVWKARVRVRDVTGERREIKRVSPDKRDSRGRLIPDREGTRAHDAVLAAAAAIMQSELDVNLSPDTTIRSLWLDHYRPYLVEQGRARETMKRYDAEAEGFDSAFGQRRLSETGTKVIENYLTAVANTRGASCAKSSRSVLSGMYNYAIRVSDGAIKVNPVREVKLTKKKDASKPAGALHLTVDEVRQILLDIQTSKKPCPVILSAAERRKNRKRYAPPTVAQFCERVDLVDWIVMRIATAHRRSQSLAIRWADLDLDAGILHPAKKLARLDGGGLELVDVDGDPKASENGIALPKFAVEMLKARKKRIAARKLVHPDPIDPAFEDLVFPSERWTPRDPHNVDADWRRVRAALGLHVKITGHSFRKAVATILDDAGLSATVAADVLGHSDPSMTQRVYFARRRTHPAAADAVHQAITGQHPA